MSFQSRPPFWKRFLRYILTLVDGNGRKASRFCNEFVKALAVVDGAYVGGATRSCSGCIAESDRHRCEAGAAICVQA